MRPLDNSPILQQLKAKMNKIVGRPSCWRKQKHKSEGKANAHIRALHRRAEAEHHVADLSLYPYQCRHCGCWHVGHPRKKEVI